jgi:hypothetical protein
VSPWMSVLVMGGIGWRNEGFVLYNYHYRLKLQAGMDRVLTTVGSSHKPAAIYRNITAIFWLELKVIRTSLSVH